MDTKKPESNKSELFNSMGVSASGPPLLIPDLDSGLGMRFYNNLDKYKEKIHQVDASTGITETKNSVKTRAMKVATELRKNGVSNNNVVIISSKVHLDLTVSVLGCLFIGAIVAPLHTDHSYEEMRKFVQILQPKFAFCGNRSARLLLRIVKEEHIRCPIYLYQSDNRDFIAFNKCFTNKEDPHFVVATIPDPKTTIAFISYTEGTEGDEKLVSITHHAMAMRYIPLLDWAFKKNEKVISTFPLSNFMQLVVMCICFDSGAKHILGAVTERGICKVIHDLRVEILFVSAAIATLICKNVPVVDFDLSSLKMVFVTNAISTANYIRVVRTFKKTIIVTDYTTVETGTIAYATQDTYLKNRDKINSIGQLCPGVSVKIVPPQVGVAPPGWGELYIKSPGLMYGYYNNHVPVKAMSRGFFKTGDLAKVDAETFLYIRGRISDEVSRDNQVFSALEVDNAIQAHPAIQESATFVNDFGDLVSCVVKRPGREISQETILQVVAEVLPIYKVPTKIMFRDSLPKTPMGTVKKYKIRETINTLIREESFYHADVDE